MKKSLFLLGMASLVTIPMAAIAADAPTVYGHVKKEMKYLKQDDKAGYRSFYGPLDVEGFESRLGVKGALPAGSLKAGYNLEIGLNSARNNKDSATASYTGGPGVDERIRIRQANGSLMGEFGTFTIGQANPTGFGRTAGWDPLLGTSAELLGADNALVVGDVALYPLLPRGTSFVNLVSYQSPSFNGLKLTLSFDNDDQSTGLHYGSGASTARSWWTGEVAYDAEFSGNKLWVTAVYAKQSLDKVKSDFEQNYWQLGAKFATDKLTASAGLVSKTTVKKVTNNSFLLGFSYKVTEPLVLAANFSHTKFDDDNATATGGAGANMTGTETQYGFGPIYSLSENVSTHLVLGITDRESEKGNLALVKDTTKKDNTATMLALGATFKF